MATSVQPIIEPNVEAIGAHLAFLFEPCVADYPNGLVEIAHGADGRLTSANLFPLTKQGMAEAVAYAVEQNRRGENVYVGVNPRKPGTQDNKRASAKDVEIAFFHFADLDQEEHVTMARHRMPIKPTMIVMTGTKPSNRPHLYWRLEEPVGNLVEWSARQRGIAQTLGGDMVIDPPRIMRLGGTVNYPTQDKLAKRGYAVELTSVKTDFADERVPVTPEQVAAAFPAQEQLSGISGQLNGAVQSLEGQTTLAAMARSRSADFIAACKSGDQWHNNMRDLVAHLAGIGTPSPVILALAAEITLPGYAVEQTRSDMAVALRGAREKWGIVEPDEPALIEQRTEEREGVFTFLTLDQLEALPPPTYIIADLLTETGLAVLYGDPGAGKSFVALDMALRLAYGMDWHGRITRQTGVLYIAGEGHAGLGLRVKGWRREHGLEGVDAPFLLLPEAVQMLEDGEVDRLLRTIDAARAGLDIHIGLTVIDTVSRAITGADENKQDAISKFVHSVSRVQRHVSGAAMGIHHTGKDVSRGMRGSTVLIGACDTSIRCKGDLKVAKSVTLAVEKQKDGEQIDDVILDMKTVEWSVGLEKPVTTLVPHVGKEPTTEAGETGLSRHQIGRIFAKVREGWDAKQPWSSRPQTRDQGRFLPAWIASEMGVKESLAISFLAAWLMNGCLEIAECDRNKKKNGLRVVRELEG